MFFNLLFLTLQYVLEFCVCSLFFTIISMLALRLYSERFNAKCNCTSRLDGKTVLVTGGSSGIGLETARDLARRGPRLIITCINEKTAKAAVEELIETTGNKNIHYRQLNLSSFDNIQSFAKDINESFDNLHILVNNAGMAGCDDTITEDGLEITMQVNYVGPALLTLLLLPKLKASKPSRIVTVSSKAGRTADITIDDITSIVPMRLWKRYANSKLCIMLWMKALSRRLPEGVTSNIVQPGIVKTNIFVNHNHYLTNGIFMFLLGRLFKTAEEGAQTSILACVSPQLEGVTGEYLSECQISNTTKLFKDLDFTEKIWEKTKSIINSRLTDGTRI